MIIPKQERQQVNLNPVEKIMEQFEPLKDPRIDRTKKHKLLDIVTIALCGVICGANTWVDIENFGKAKREWLDDYLDLLNGIPSHDTFGCVFAHLAPDQFQNCFYNWMQAVREQTKGQVIPLDGRCDPGIFRSTDRPRG